MTDLPMTDPGTQTPARFISITRARCIARYRMRSIPGRPEELESNQVFRIEGGNNNVEDGVDVTRRVLSFAYAGGELRIRKHGGERNREWIEVRDFRLRDGWLSEVYDYLDDWLGFISPKDIRAPRSH